MDKQILMVGIIVLLVCVGLSGCTETNTNGLSAEEQRFVGTWVNTEIEDGITKTASYTFFSNKKIEIITNNGTGVGYYNGTWRIADNVLYFSVVASPAPVTIRTPYNFSSDFNTLTLRNATGAPLDFIKQ